MVRTYQRRIDNTRRQKYTSENLRKALSSIKKKRYTVRKAAEIYEIPRSTLQDRLKRSQDTEEDSIVVGRLGRKPAITELEEKVLFDIVLLCANWGFPVSVMDVRVIVQGYLNSIKKKVDQFGPLNLPGEEWARQFLKRHPKLAVRFGENIKRVRGEVSPEAVNRYFDELEVSLHDVDPANIVNYDETAFVDDAGKQRFIFRRGKRSENVQDHSKVGTTVMFACAGNGVLLPPYVVYKATNIYDTWVLNGPTGTCYNSAKSGWFTRDLFEDWFHQVALRYFRRSPPGPKVLIGDNLCSHMSYNIIKKAIDAGIRFIFLPPNSTHLSQPLDVGVFRPLKGTWRKKLAAWKQKKKGPIDKSEFPNLLHEAVKGTVNMKENIISSFRATGIVPLNRQQVLKRLPQVESEADIASHMLFPVIKLLQENRFAAESTTRRGRKRKIKTPAGRAVQLSDFEHDSDGDNIDDDIDDEMDHPSADKSHDDADSEVEGDSGDDSASEDESALDNGLFPLPDPEINDFYSVTFITEHDHGSRTYIGKVLSMENETIRLKFMRRRPGKAGDIFVFPNIDDIVNVDISQLTHKMTVHTERRGIFTFIEPVVGIL